MSIKYRSNATGKLYTINLDSANRKELVIVLKSAMHMSASDKRAIEYKLEQLTLNAMEELCVNL